MKTLLSIILISITTVIYGQNTKVNNGTEGFWTGAMIKNGNSAQLFEVEFFQEDDTTRAAFSIPDWAYYSPFISNVSQEGRVVRFGSYFGEMTLVLDSAYAEMIGDCDFADVHMKKGLRSPRIKTLTSEIQFDLGDIKVDAEIIRPEGKGPFTTVIIVHGRGCGSKDDWSQRPAVLAQYGMAVVTYDKRGHERTGYPCEMTNMRQHARDLVKVTQKVKGLKYTEDVGYLAYSAGGWVAPMSASQIDVDFMATVVGPSTSVKQQQLDCSVYYVRDELQLDEDAVNEAVAYCELEFSDDTPEVIFEQMSSLLDSARVNGWIDVLEDSDIIGSPEGLDSLWVRRNRYDPAEDLQAFEGPFLSVLGGSDYVVPYKENTDRFVELFDNVSKTNYRITMIPSANHGMEHWHKARDLGYESSIKKWHTYFKFDRVAPGAMDEFISFMRQYGFID